MSKTYRGTRLEDGTCMVEVVLLGVSADLAPRLDLFNHSPTGFEWSYRGSGPAQLSLAMLADALADDARALRLYQRFKFKHTANFDRAGFELTEQQVRTFAEELEREEA